MLWFLKTVRETKGRADTKAPLPFLLGVQIVPIWCSDALPLLEKDSFDCNGSMPIRKKSRTAFSFLNRPKSGVLGRARLGIISFSLEEAWFAWVPYSKKGIERKREGFNQPH